jgi:hypothetical protein
MQNITVRFGKNSGKLKLLTSDDAAKYFQFEKDLAEGEIVEVYITKIENEDNKTSGQLAKVHACIRELARETCGSWNYFFSIYTRLENNNYFKKSEFH